MSNPGLSKRNKELVLVEPHIKLFGRAGFRENNLRMFDALFFGRVQ